MKKGEKKSAVKCIYYGCQNLRYEDKLLCHNHWRIREKLYSYRKKYGDLKEI